MKKIHLVGNIRLLKVVLAITASSLLLNIIFVASWTLSSPAHAATKAARVVKRKHK